jgi:hypothetical protein
MHANNLSINIRGTELLTLAGKDWDSARHRGKHKYPRDRVINKQVKQAKFVSPAYLSTTLPREDWGRRRIGVRRLRVVCGDMGEGKRKRRRAQYYLRVGILARKWQ